MQYIPVKTRVMQPPQDDLFSALDEALTDVRDEDVVAISSKVVSVHEGNCYLASETDKDELVRQESDVQIPREYWHSPLTITRSAFIGTAGVDESNTGGYLVPLPADAFLSAKNIREYLRERFNLTRVGVLITDSQSMPMRRGATGISVGWSGFHPTINHIGESDLFGREMQVEVANLVDGIAAGATVVMGEVAELQPAVVVRDIPNIKFTANDTRDESFVPFAEDTFRVLYQNFLTSEGE